MATEEVVAEDVPAQDVTADVMPAEEAPVLEAPVLEDAPVEEVPAAEEVAVAEVVAEPETEVAPAPIPEPIPAAIRPVRAEQPSTLNLLAVVALALGVIGGPVAIIFGIFAVRQIKQTGERGMLLARIAIGLGILWLVIWIVVIAWVVVNGAV